MDSPRGILIYQVQSIQPIPLDTIHGKGDRNDPPISQTVYLASFYLITIFPGLPITSARRICPFPGDGSILPGPEMQDPSIEIHFLHIREGSRI